MTTTNIRTFFLLIFVILFYSRCTKPIIEKPDVLPTRLKMADANVDITIQYPVNYIMLNGNVIGKASGTSIKSTSWKQISGPQAYINNPQSLQTRVSNLDTEGTYEFELTVLDNANHFDQDTMTVNVENATSTNSQVFLWNVKWTQNETGFDELHIDIENFIISFRQTHLLKSLLKEMHRLRGKQSFHQVRVQGIPVMYIFSEIT